MCNNEAHNNKLLLHQRTNGRVFYNRLGLVDDFGSQIQSLTGARGSQMNSYLSSKCNWSDSCQLALTRRSFIRIILTFKNAVTP